MSSLSSYFVLILGCMETAILEVTFGAVMIDGLMDMVIDSLRRYMLS